MTATFFVGEALIYFDILEHVQSYYLGGTGLIGLSIIFMFFVAREFLRKKAKSIKELEQKNTYLEHAAKIIRHDMHSGINTYLPRGVKALKRKLSPQQIKDLNIGSPLKMLEAGLSHTQKVYDGVYEFTNLVKKDAQMSIQEHDVREVLSSYLESTSYKSQVVLDGSLSFDLPINKPLFCTALDNLIRNGLKYNDSDTKTVKIYKHGNYIVVEDNGRGMSKEEYEYLSLPYVRKEGQKEHGTGLGLNICRSILKEHDFSIKVEKLEGGVGMFFKELEEIEAKWMEKPDFYAYDRESLERVAKEHNYKGKLRCKLGGRNKNKVYVIYDEKRESCRGTKIMIKFKK